MSNATQLNLFGTAPVPPRFPSAPFFAWCRENHIDRQSTFSGVDLYRKGDHTLAYERESDTYILTRWECSEDRLVSRHQEEQAGLVALAAVTFVPEEE